MVMTGKPLPRARPQAVAFRSNPHKMTKSQRDLCSPIGRPDIMAGEALFRKNSMIIKLILICKQLKNKETKNISGFIYSGLSVFAE